MEIITKRTRTTKGFITTFLPSLIYLLVMCLYIKHIDNEETLKTFGFYFLVLALFNIVVSIGRFGIGYDSFKSKNIYQLKSIELGYYRYGDKCIKYEVKKLRTGNVPYVLMFFLNPFQKPEYVSAYSGHNGDYKECYIKIKDLSEKDLSELNLDDRINISKLEEIVYKDINHRFNPNMEVDRISKRILKSIKYE